MEEKEFDYINMIPLIDVMLVLLTIVLMTSTFIMGGMIRVELPRVSAEQEAMVRSRSLDMDQAGRIYYDGRWVSVEAAIQCNAALVQAGGPQVPHWTKRELLVLEMVRNHFRTHSP